MLSTTRNNWEGCRDLVPFSRWRLILDHCRHGSHNLILLSFRILFTLYNMYNKSLISRPEHQLYQFENKLFSDKITLCRPCCTSLVTVLVNFCIKFPITCWIVICVLRFSIEIKRRDFRTHIQGRILIPCI